VTTLFEQRLAEFVDRQAEMTRFGGMLDSGNPRILFVSGESGLGKSSLIARMIHECSVRNFRRAEIVWTDTCPGSYLWLMRKIRDAIGAEHFVRLSDLINYFTVPQYELKITVDGNISVGQNMTVSNSQVGDVTGVVIKDLMLATPRPDTAVPEQERRSRLTDTFLEDLARVAGAGRIVIFLDAVEKMSSDTEAWIWQDVLARIRDDKLPNVTFVLGGHRSPTLDRDWGLCAVLADLKPLAYADVLEYLVRRGVPEADRATLAKAVFPNSHGKISNIAAMVDGFLRFDPNTT
jgi:AAA ATPase-like protein